MAITLTTTSFSSPKFCNMYWLQNHKPKKPTIESTSSLSLGNLRRSLTISKSHSDSDGLKLLTGTAVAGVVCSSMVASSPAMAAQQIVEIAGGTNRGMAILLPLIPAIAWALYNILGPALNQIDRMRSKK